MNDYVKLFKAFVCPYLAAFFGSCIGFTLVTGQDTHQMLWVIFLGAMTELGFEFGIIPIVKAKKRGG